MFVPRVFCGEVGDGVDPVLDADISCEGGDGFGKRIFSVMFQSGAWQEVGKPGVQLALAWGDPEAGSDVWLLRMAPGTGIPSHAHTNDYWGLTIQGMWVHVHDDGSETVTIARNYSLIEGGVFHADRCDGAEDCIRLMDFDGFRDALHFVFGVVAVLMMLVNASRAGLPGFGGHPKVSTNERHVRSVFAPFWAVAAVANSWGFSAALG